MFCLLNSLNIREKEPEHKQTRTQLTAKQRHINWWGEGKQSRSNLIEGLSGGRGSDNGAFCSWCVWSVSEQQCLCSYSVLLGSKLQREESNEEISDPGQLTKRHDASLSGHLPKHQSRRSTGALRWGFLWFNNRSHTLLSVTPDPSLLWITLYDLRGSSREHCSTLNFKLYINYSPI